jgi:uncharacterized RDD family membrane protein YckC
LVVELIIGGLGHGFYTIHGIDSFGTTSTTFHVRPWMEGVSFLLTMAYGTLLCGGPRGQTVGMMAVSVKAVDPTSGGSIGYGRALWRAFFEWLMAIIIIPWIIDMLWPLWDQRNQTLHDKVSNTVVVRTN